MVSNNKFITIVSYDKWSDYDNNTIGRVQGYVYIVRMTVYLIRLVTIPKDMVLIKALKL